MGAQKTCPPIFGIPLKFLQRACPSVLSANAGALNTEGQALCTHTTHDPRPTTHDLRPSPAPYSKLPTPHFCSYHALVTISVLHDFHAGLGATFMSVNGVEFVANYGDASAEHRALHEGAGVIDLSGRGRLVLLGADRQKLLNGQVTNNIKDLPVGKGCYAALVNAKAKMVADLNIFALASELLLDLEPGLAGPVAERLEKFIVADDVQIVDAAPHYGLLSVQGRHAVRTFEQLGLFPSLPTEPLAHVALHHPDYGELYLMNHPRLGHRGFDLFVPLAALATVADRLIATARDFGGRPCGFEAFEIARMEAGIPR